MNKMLNKIIMAYKDRGEIKVELVCPACQSYSEFIILTSVRHVKQRVCKICGNVFVPIEGTWEEGAVEWIAKT